MNKVVFITGGSRGIGACAVKMFAEAGYRVAFTYLKSENEALCLSKSTGALAIKADASNSKEMSDAIRCACEELGHIDILINNVGISEFSLFTDISDDMWHKMLDTNLSSAFYASRAVLPQMISRKDGCIINVSSMWGQVGASCEVHYSASKAGLIGLTKALAKEVAPSGIRVNCVVPGAIDTEMNACLSDEAIEEIKSETPLGRLGTPEEIANILLFLADERSSFITGQVIGANGGMII
ncbi:MAG: SDR family oxidoreductase [Ruminococcaceae bacterium]|nr:SDR family oxidoreductase [Oscillospiraceae bacterium]